MYGTYARRAAGLLGEGAVQVLYSRDEYITDPVLAAVGQLQFEVVQYRMKVRLRAGRAAGQRGQEAWEGRWCAGRCV